MLIMRPGQQLYIPGVQVLHTNPPTATFSGVLDGISNVAAAYSLRKLRSAYAGAAVRIRRSSDSTEQDIGFDGAGEFDSAAFSAFVGGGTGFVRTWYDQSGNNKDVAQSTSGNQPSIILSSIGSKAAVRFSNSFLSGLLSVTTSNTTNIIVCRENSSVNDAGFIVLHPGTGNDYDSNNAIWGGARSSTQNFEYGRASVAAPIRIAGSKPTPAAIYSGVHNPNATLRKNGASMGTQNNANIGTATTVLLGGRLLGGTVSALYRLDGDISEVIIMAIAISATDHNIIGNSMATRYGFSWTNV